MPGPTPLTTSNDSSIAVCTSTQRRNKVPIGYNGTPEIHPKLPVPLRRSPPKSNTPIPSRTPLTTPNAIQIQSAVLPLLTCADRSGRTNGTDECSIHHISAPLYRERRAKNTARTSERITYVHGETQTPLVRFVVDMFYKQIRNKSTTNRTSVQRLNQI